MEAKEFYARIREDYKVDKTSKKYRVTLDNGRTEILRTFYSTYGDIGYHGKGMRTHGFNITFYPYRHVVSMRLVDKRDRDATKLIFDRLKRRMNDAKYMLEASGLWQDILENINLVLSKGDDTIMEIAKALSMEHYSSLYDEVRNGKLSFLTHYQIYTSFARNKCWHSIPYLPSDKEFRKKRLQSAIENGIKYSYAWRNGYNNCVEVNFEDGKGRGWFSAEYKGFCNGHYYLLFDASHAIFYEDD